LRQTKILLNPLLNCRCFETQTKGDALWSKRDKLKKYGTNQKVGARARSFRVSSAGIFRTCGGS
jgi:hypothetical protein